jgi:hypothetical protein
MRHQFYLVAAIAITVSACGGSSGESSQINAWFPPAESDTPPAGSDIPPPGGDSIPPAVDEFSPEVSGIWNGSGNDSVTNTASEVFLFTADDGRLILAARNALYAEGTATLTNYDLVGSVVANTPKGLSFQDGSDSAECSFTASFNSASTLSGSYTCPNGDNGTFDVSRISPLGSPTAAL